LVYIIFLIFFFCIQSNCFLYLLMGNKNEICLDSDKGFQIWTAYLPLHAPKSIKSGKKKVLKGFLSPGHKMTIQHRKFCKLTRNKLKKRHLIATSTDVSYVTEGFLTKSDVINVLKAITMENELSFYIQSDLCKLNY
jgi:hypothetical protein